MLRIFDSNLNFIGEIDDFKSCIMTRKYLGIETLELTISLRSQNAGLLNKHCIIFVGSKKVFEILHKQIDTDDNEKIKIVAFGFAKTLGKRITIPPVGNSHDSFTGSADAVVKHYITANIITPSDPNRKIPYMEIAPIQNGSEITDQTRLKNLNEEITRVLQASGRGCCFDLDVTLRKIVFDTYLGIDRTVGNPEDISPVIFSIDFDNLLDQSFVDSMTDAKTQIYVGGQGEGDSRTIVEVGDSSGAERFEVFTDARDISNVDELTNRGLSEIVSEIRNFEANIDPNGQFEYEDDYDLGDLITLQSNQLGIVMDARITEIREIYQQGEPRQIEVVIGDKYPSFLADIKDQNRKISQLSTVESVGSGPVGTNQTYIYDQIASSDTWIINHNLSSLPSVTVVDSAGSVVVGDVSYTDGNQIIITFTSAFSGKAYLN